METCICCGKEDRTYNMHYTIEGIVCDDCYYTEFATCDGCGEEFFSHRLSEYYYGRERRYYCERCEADNTFECEICKDSVVNDDCYYIDNMCVCSNCYEERKRKEEKDDNNH